MSRAGQLHCYQTQAKRCVKQVDSLAAACILWNAFLCSGHISSLWLFTYFILWYLSAPIWELVFPACSGCVRSSGAKWGGAQIFREWPGFGTWALEDLIRNWGAAHSSPPSLSQLSFCYCEVNLMLVQMTHRLRRSNEILGGKSFLNFKMSVTRHKSSIWKGKSRLISLITWAFHSTPGFATLGIL